MAAKTSSKDIKFENLLGLSIEIKRGFYNYGTPGSSKLNSLIQILTSIKEIHDDLRYSKYDEKGSGANKKSYYSIGGKTDHKTTSGAYCISGFMLYLVSKNVPCPMRLPSAKTSTR